MGTRVKGRGEGGGHPGGRRSVLGQCGRADGGMYQDPSTPYPLLSWPPVLVADGRTCYLCTWGAGGGVVAVGGASVGGAVPHSRRTSPGSSRPISSAHALHAGPRGPTGCGHLSAGHVGALARRAPEVGHGAAEASDASSRSLAGDLSQGSRSRAALAVALGGVRARFPEAWKPSHRLVLSGRRSYYATKGPAGGPFEARERQPGAGVEADASAWRRGRAGGCG